MGPCKGLLTIKGSVFETGVERLFTQGRYQWTIRDGQKAS